MSQPDDWYVWSDQMRAMFRWVKATKANYNRWPTDEDLAKWGQYQNIQTHKVKVMYEQAREALTG